MCLKIFRHLHFLQPQRAADIAAFAAILFSAVQ